MVLAEPQDGQVDIAVAVHIERIGAGGFRHVETGRLFERKHAAGFGAIDVERSRVRATGQEQVRHPIAVAIEGRRTAADEKFERATIGVVDACGCGFLVHIRHVEGKVCRVGRYRDQCKGDEPAFHCGMTSVLR